MNAGRAVYEILSNDTDLSAIVGSRIYPEVAPEDVTTPFVVYSIQSVEPIRVKNSTSTLDVANFEVYTSSADYAEAMDINDAIRTAMERRAGNFSGVAIDSIEYIDENVVMDPDSREYVSELRFRLRIARAGSVSSQSNIVPLGVNVRETDDTAVSFVKTVVFPDTSLSVSNDVATVTFSTSGGGGTSTVEMATAAMTATNATFNATETLVPLGSVNIDTGSHCEIATGSLQINVDATVLVTVQLSVSADTNNQWPHLTVYHGTRDVVIATGYISGSLGDDHTTLSASCMVSIASGDKISLKAYNDASNNTIAVNSATVSVVILE